LHLCSTPGHNRDAAVVSMIAIERDNQRNSRPPATRRRPRPGAPRPAARVRPSVPIAVLLGHLLIAAALELRKRCCREKRCCRDAPGDADHKRARSPPTREICATM
jgi:hypothetical protein